MKSLIISLIAFASSAAMAWPTVGDTATFNVLLTLNNQTMTGTMALNTTAIDATADTMTVAESVSIAGQSQVQNANMKLSEFSSLATMVQDITTNCPTVNGTIEAVTVPAGKFNACKVTDANGATWFANVTYGIVKQVETDPSTGMVTEMDLVSYK